MMTASHGASSTSSLKAGLVLLCKKVSAYAAQRAGLIILGFFNNDATRSLSLCHMGEEDLVVTEEDLAVQSQ
jgi:hypothetical protein